MPEIVGRVALAAIEVAAVMPRCRDCRWWATEASPPDRRTRDCALFGDYRTPDMPEPLALPSGGAGSTYECLETDPDFGCVQFEAKP